MIPGLRYITNQLLILWSQKTKFIHLLNQLEAVFLVTEYLEEVYSGPYSYSLKVFLNL